MYIFEINLKNSPSAPCHNIEKREWLCVCVLGVCVGGGVSDRKAVEVHG